ncbi:MAG: hypothetical protein LBR39_01980, partial [Coriobacteriales bacterium]|nr:hypothetical protein [Coriobacteriales bacterium]
MISAVAAAAATAASAAAGAPVAVPGVFSLLAILNLGNTTLGRIIMGVVNFYVLLIIVWALFSWFDHSKGF